MSKNVSLSLPLDPYALQKGAELLADLADHFATNGEPFCKHCGAYEFPEPAEVTVESESDVADRSHIEATIPSGDGGTLGTGAEEQLSEAELAFGKTAEVLDAATEVYSIPPEIQKAADQAIVNVALGSPAAVEAAKLLTLDGDGLPWDGRIHAASKAKLSKAPHGWKKKRGVSAELVAEVEAELRQALAASPDSPVVTVTVPHPDSPAALGAAYDMSKDKGPDCLSVVAPPAATNPDGVRMITVSQCGEQVEVPITSVIFPEFMALVTAAGIPTATALAAVNLAGLQSILLLATRQDLIPNVIETLFPAGA